MARSTGPTTTAFRCRADPGSDSSSAPRTAPPASSSRDPTTASSSSGRRGAPNGAPSSFTIARAGQNCASSSARPRGSSSTFTVCGWSRETGIRPSRRWLFLVPRAWLLARLSCLVSCGPPFRSPHFVSSRPVRLRSRMITATRGGTATRKPPRTKNHTIRLRALGVGPLENQGRLARDQPIRHLTGSETKNGT